MQHRQDQTPSETIEPGGSERARPGRTKAADRSAIVAEHRIEFPTVVPVVRPVPVDNGQW